MKSYTIYGIEYTHDKLLNLLENLVDKVEFLEEESAVQRQRIRNLEDDLYCLEDKLRDNGV